MLIQLPRGLSGREPSGPNKNECSPFEAALRRDLANAPVVAYEAVLGGWLKRTFDVAIVVLTAPLWAMLLACLAAYAKLRHLSPVFVEEERIGYGGRAFRRLRLRLAPPSAVIERLHPELDAASEDAVRAVGRAEKWRRALGRVPELINVLRGDMSLVGPRPLERDEVEELRAGRRYYLSARPGVIGVGHDEDDEQGASPYKAYALGWSLGADLRVVSRAVRDLRDRGELWRPRVRLLVREPSAEAALALVRRRSS